MIQHESVSAAGYGPPGFGPPPGGGYGGPPPGGGYGGPPPGGYGGPPPGGFGGYGAPPPPGGFGPPPPGGFGGPPLGPMGMQPPSSSLAIAALVCGILAIPGACCCYSGVPLGIAAAVMGGMAMQKAKANPQAYGGHGMALGGLICGILAVLFTIVMFALGMSMQLMEQLNH